MLKLESGARTRSPSLTFCTPGPTSRTRPTASLPITVGSAGRNAWRSPGAALAFPPSAALKHDLVAEPTGTMIEESCHARLHVCALEEWRGGFVAHTGCRAGASVGTGSA